MEKYKQHGHAMNWSILFLLLITTISSGIYRDGFATLFPFLQTEFELTRAQIGLQSTFFFLTSALFAVFAGRLVDILGTKKGILFGLGSSGILVALHTFAPSFVVLLLIAGLTGLGTSMIAPATNKGIIERFTIHNRATAMGLNYAGFSIGGALASVSLPLIASYYSWRLAALLIGILTIISTAVIFVFYREIGAGEKAIKGKDEAKKPSFYEEFCQLLNNRYMLLMGLLGFVFGSTSGIIATHFTLFLHLDYGLPETLAGLGFGAAQIGGSMARPGWGFISDRVFRGNRENGLLAMGILFTFISLLFAFFTQSLNYIIIFILGFFIAAAGRGWNGLYFTAVAELAGEDNTGMSVGFTFLFIRLGLMLAPPVFGFIADKRGAYDYSWFLSGLMVFVVSVLTYYHLKKVKREEKRAGVNIPL
ncbi:MAG: MFS transporter [bacterium]|jgi:ACS family hexuronate transporter-like MFS transporter